jgi:hypothetical protein
MVSNMFVQVCEQILFNIHKGSENWFDQKIECCERNQNDETPSIINKPKQLEKGRYKEQNGRTQVQEDKWTT